MLRDNRTARTLTLTARSWGKYMFCWSAVAKQLAKFILQTQLALVDEERLARLTTWCVYVYMCSILCAR